MQDNIVTLFATFKARSGMEDGLKKELLTLVEPTRKENGCIYYYLHNASDDPSVFIFYEQWKNIKDLNKHSNSEHLKKAMANTKNMVSVPVELKYLKLI